MTTIDLNCDLGESFGAWEMGNDGEMIGLATSVHVACGFHAGDARAAWRAGAGWDTRAGGWRGAGARSCRGPRMARRAAARAAYGLLAEATVTD